MHKISTFIRYFVDFLQFGQVRLVIASFIYILTKKSFIKTRIIHSKLGLFLHRKGSLDFQFANYAYEWNVKKIMNKYYKEYQVFIDIGSNIGTYTIMLAKRGLRTYAFEPAYENFRALKVNVLLNNLEETTTIYNVGLSDTNTKASFVFDPLNTGASHLDGIPAEDIEAELRGISTEIELVRFDDIFNEMNIKNNEKILMKIDVEGMESSVLLGAEIFFKQHPNILLVMESVHSGEDKLKNILNQFGVFEYIPVDALNMAAKKIGNIKT
ncbi:MAG: hypothetical protein CVT92_06585 [Bacteroidetes bacterium HGW-Bacteroidetes-1]|nr:MAG: hypothetical protein CVT92_06585 [Bacteroidetes bacterium HGW-Bacteroidetes-1]